MAQVVSTLHPDAAAAALVARFVQLAGSGDRKARVLITLGDGRAVLAFEGRKAAALERYHEIGNRLQTMLGEFFASIEKEDITDPDYGPAPGSDFVCPTAAELSPEDQAGK